MLSISLTWQLNNNTKKMRGKSVSVKVIFALCIASFLAGSLFTTRTRPHPSDYSHHLIPKHLEKYDALTHECDHKRVSLKFAVLSLWSVSEAG